MLADRRLHDRWWHADTLVDEINTRCQLADDLQLQKQEVDKINTRCRLANEVQVQKQLLRIVIRHTEASDQQEMILLSSINNSFYTAVTLSERRRKTKEHDFFHVTSSKAVPVFPTATNAASWTTNNASEALPPRTRQRVDFLIWRNLLPLRQHPKSAENRHRNLQVHVKTVLML
jgi:hypothetical protein